MSNAAALPPAESIERGIAALRARRYQDALALFEDLRRTWPNDAELLSLCGLAHLRCGQALEAGPLLARAVELEPLEPGMRLNLAEFLDSNGQAEAARAELARILEQQPAHLVARLRLVNALNGCGRCDDALKVLEMAPPQHAGHVLLRLAYAESLGAKGDWRRMASFAQDWIDSDRENPDAWLQLSRAQFEMGRHRLSLDSHRRFLERRSGNADTWTQHARICIHALEFDAAEQALANAEALEAGHVGMLATKALLLTSLGRLDEAEACCKRCLGLDPDYIPVYSTLSRLNNGRFDDNELKALQRAATRADLPVAWRISANFALGDAHEAANAAQQAFACYDTANRLSRERYRAEGIHYDSARSAARTAQIMQLFDHDPAPRDEQEPRSGPIFIIGMPRSGTTLLESVLAAHSQVSAGGELPAMQQILEQLLHNGASSVSLPEQALQSWSRQYLEQLPRTAPPGTRVSDKHPLNFEAAGLIARLFPDSAIIHVRRNPLETALSIYCHEFEKHWDFANSLEHIAHYYGQYARLMAHWQKVLGTRIVTISYEQLASALETEAPALLQSCSLAWEDGCLAPHQAQQRVATLSAVQVRQPARLRNHRTSMYEEYLGPLIAALRAAGVDPESGALLQDPGNGHAA